MPITLYDKDELEAARKAGERQGFERAEQLLEQILSGERNVRINVKTNEFGDAVESELIIVAEPFNVWSELILRLDR